MLMRKGPYCMAVDLTYDAEANAAYLELAPRNTEARKRQVWASPEGLKFDLVLDLDPDGRLLGVEIIGARDALTQETLAAATKET